MDKLNNKWEALVRKNIQALTPYMSARRIGGSGDVWLNANENYAAPNLGQTTKNFNRYPEAQPQQLIENYAAYTGLKNDQVLTHRGGDEGIELVIRTFCENDEAILFCPPTYGMYEISAQTADIAVKKVPLLDDFSFDLEGIAKNLDKVKVVFLCSPNNPTGTTLKRSQLEQILALCDKQIVVVDEAYIEFNLDNTATDLLEKWENLLILRTLSKAFGLAGLRVGFSLANPWLISALSKVIAPYPIPRSSSRLAALALEKENIAKMQQDVVKICTMRNELSQQLAQLNCVEQIYPSEANFILVRFKDGDKVFKYLWDNGIILRNQSSQTKLSNCIRITVGSEDENAKVIAAIKAFN